MLRMLDLNSKEALYNYGTPGYKAPEIEHGVKVINLDLYKKRDVYSFGRLIAELYHHDPNVFHQKKEYNDIIKYCCGYNSSIIPTYETEEDNIATYTVAHITDKLKERLTIKQVITQLKELKLN